jgi:histidine triad (HIT) family protein
MSECVFCRIVRGEIPAKVVARDGAALAFEDLSPQAPVHVLVVPTRHVASAADADGATLGAVFALATRVAAELGLSTRGYRLVTNVGDEGGQSVHHLHVHLLGGRQMRWPPG